MTQSEEHGQQQPTCGPAAMLHMLHRNRGGNGIELQPPLPGQDPEPDRCADHGIDKQDDQHRMHQRQPLAHRQRWKGSNQGNTSGQS